jgi:hypothetical protein
MVWHIKFLHLLYIIYLCQNNVYQQTPVVQTNVRKERYNSVRLMLNVVTVGMVKVAFLLMVSSSCKLTSLY